MLEPRTKYGHASPKVAEAIARHQATANRQASTWMDRELRAALRGEVWKQTADWKGARP